MLLLEGDKLQRLELFGEDTCDLVRMIEDSFGIMFTEDELVQAKTIGELAHCIMGKLKHPVSRQCLSAVVFYRLRHTFSSLFNIRREKITPATSLYELMRWKNRKKQWREIQNNLNFVLPKLSWPLWLVGLSLLIAGLLLTLLGPAGLWSFASASELIKIAVFFFVWISALALLSPLARTFPRSCESFGDLVTLTLACNYGKIVSEHGVSSEREVLQVLRQLIAAEIALEVEEISPDTLFPEGLHIY